MKTLIIAYFFLTPLGGLAQIKPEEKLNHIIENESNIIEVVLIKGKIKKSKQFLVLCEAEIKNLSNDKLTLKCYKDTNNPNRLLLEQNQDFVVFYKEKDSAKAEFLQLISPPGSYESYNSTLILDAGKSGKIHIEFAAPDVPTQKIYKCDFFVSSEGSAKKLKVTTKEFMIEKP